MSIPEMENCTHDCGTCGSACGSADGERKPSFFDRLESISETFDEIGEDNLMNMLDELTAELAKEDEE